MTPETKGQELVAWTRQVTGRPYVHRAYVYAGKKVVAACSHDHRSGRTAVKCADRMKRRLEREAGSDE